jgi:ATP-dependent helicase/nuclease subunit B
MVISLTMEKNTRGNLFEASLETYKKIKKMFKEVEEIEVEEEKKDQILKHLHKNLFKESKIERILAENKISIFKAPSIRREVEELAKEIKKLICFEKISPNEILILFRNIDDYRDVLENVFKEYDLPLSIDWGKSILSSPLIRFILSIFEVFKEDFSREIINKLINSNYSKFKLERLPSIAKELGIIKGKSSWKQKIDQKKEILKNEILYLKNNKDNILEGERLRDYLKELEEFEKVIEELFKALDKIPSNGSFFKFIISLKQVVKDIGLKENILSSGDLDLFKEELVALNKFNESLEELLLLDSLKIFNKKISKETFYEFLKIYLEGRVYQTPSQKDFSIKIVDIHRGRTLSSRILFLGGLIEGVFPKRESSLPLYNEFERIKLNKLGLNLPLSLKYNEEKFLFYSALSIALERIYLSYSILDQEGRENLNSYFIEEVEKIFIGVKKKNFSLSEIVPPIKEIYNEKLLFNRVIFDLWRKQVQSENYERFLLSLYNHLLKNRKYKRIIYGCLLEEFRREKAEYRGILNQKIIIDKLRNRFHKDFLYSIGLLNEYAECPFRFFSKRLLNIKEIEELDIEISPLRLGNLYHKILWRLFLLLKKDKRWIDFREFEEEELISTLEEISLEIFEEFEKKGLVAKNFLWEIKKSQIKDYLRRFIKREIEEAKISKDLSFPTYFEVSFGRTSEREDNLKVFDPLVIEGIKICGKIDRIDLKFVEGEERFLVIDYKSKYIPSKKDILIGADLQLPLYILATSKLILKDVPPYQASYYSITKAKNIVRLTFKEETEIEEIISKTINHLKENVRLIKKGYYPPISKKECSTFCSYKDICRN